ncbi:hypothetical protein [Gordonia westfalica]|nr:hypothetical protein [Gordonia westfalica]
MPRPDPRAPGEGQGAMFDAGDPAPTPRHGRHSAATERALTAAKAADLITDVDEALAAVVRASAWALDRFEAENKPYGPAKLIGPTVEALRELHLTPDSRVGGNDDEIRSLLDALGTPADAETSVSDTPQP